MNADDLVDFLLQDEDVIVSVRYEEPDLPTQTSGAAQGHKKVSKRNQGVTKPLFSEVDDILKDLEQLIVRPNSFGGLTTIEGDEWGEPEHIKQRHHKPGSKKTDRKKTTEGSEVRGDFEGNTKTKSSNDSTKTQDVALKPKKQRKKKPKKEHNDHENEPPHATKNAGPSAEKPRRNKHQNGTPHKEHGAEDKHLPPNAEKEHKQKDEGQTKEKSSKKRKNRSKAAPGSSQDGTVNVEVTKSSKLAQNKDGDDTARTERKSKKSAARHQEPGEPRNQPMSEKTSKKKHDRKGQNKSLNSEGLTKNQSENAPGASDDKSHSKPAEGGTTNIRQDDKQKSAPKSSVQKVPEDCKD